MPGLQEQQNPATLVSNRYELKNVLLECRFSTLYQAVDLENGQARVLRRLPLRAADATTSAAVLREEKSQTLREGRLLAHLHHRNLPQVLDILEHDDNVYLVLDDFGGTSLEAQVRESSEALHPELLLRFADQLLAAVEYLHAQSPPIIHRDLQPATVMVSRFGTLKLAEFGLTRMAETSADSTAFRSSGSPVYAAPEQLLGELSEVSNDLYAVGAILYFLATGQEAPPSLDRALRSAQLASVGSLRSDLPYEMISLIDALLAVPAEQRPPTASAARQRLGALHAAPGAPATHPATQREHQAATVPVAGGGATTDHAPATPAPSKSSTWRLLFGRSKTGATKPSPAESATAVLPHDQGSAQAEQGEHAPAPTSGLAAAPMVDLAQINIDRTAARVLSETVAKSIQGVCIGRLGANEITVVVTDPEQIYIYDNIAYATHSQLKPTLLRGDAQLIAHALDYVYRSDHLNPGTTWAQFLVQRRLESDVLQVTSASASLSGPQEEVEGEAVSAVDRILKESIASGASDIHLEPYEVGTDLRYRIDGELRKINVFEPERARSIIKRLKVLANLDIAQERIAQGGRISIRVGGQEFDLRVSLIPVPAGESIVMRILKKGSFNLKLADLGFSPTMAEEYQQALSQPYGMILVCGPTGSGKSTTLYASLKEIARPDRKLLTVEDPIEYQMPGIMQVQVNMTPREEEKQVSFARALREFLRQDPDVILVGEIRDPETASIAVQAALTGHMLLSTLHTNDSVGIIDRLKDMGSEAFLIGSTLIAGVGQRLARRICQDCRVEVPVPEEIRPRFTANHVPEARMFEGQGCKKCFGTGYKGRLAIYELLRITPEIRNLINRNAMASEIATQAASQGFRPLLSDGMHKVSQGLITLAEVERVCMTL